MVVAKTLAGVDDDDGIGDGGAVWGVKMTLRSFDVGG